MTSVAFSPDGTMLAAGSRGSTIMLWDVASRVRIANLEYQCGGWQSVAFSPGGAILAGAAGNSAVYLWDVRARERIATLTGQTSSVLDAVFSSDGATLAAGSRDNTVNLWDTSRWTRPRPFALEIVSGDGQRGAPGSVLAQPLVVLVKDQHGNPLSNASVTFTVTGGDGRLSGRYTSQQRRSAMPAATRQLTLTLGPRPGTYAVGVFVGSVEVATFQIRRRGDRGRLPGGRLHGVASAMKAPPRAWAKEPWVSTDRAVALSPDGRTLAVATSIGVWLYGADHVPGAGPVADGECGPFGVVLPRTARWRRDSTTAGCRAEGAWKLANGSARCGTRIGAEVTVVFSPDGSRLASGS